MSDRIYRLELGGELIESAGAFDDSFTSVQELLTGASAPGTIVVDGLTPNDAQVRNAAIDAVYQLRQSAAFFAAPIYFARTMGKLDVFVDGIATTREAAAPYAGEILARLGGLPIAAIAGSDDLRLLAFLFCRGEAYSLSPAALITSPWLYEYPAALMIGDSAEPALQVLDRLAVAGGLLRNSAEWLVALARQGFLVEQGLVDRIRTCPSCHTGNLNYVDTCPLCGSIDFAKMKMIHCFTCGHVAPEENYRNGFLFICPRCNTTLRHIGSDYDRPLESYGCNSCGGRFIEPDVRADCFNCGQQSAPADLEVRQLYNYGLSAKGKRAVQMGAIDWEFSLFDSNRNVLPLYFYQVTDWLLQMKARYSDEDFSLLGIKIAGVEALSSTAGMTQFRTLVDELAGRIRELVRSTDITTSTGPNTFWLLLPRTGQSGGEVLASRLEKLADKVALGNGVQIHIQVKCFSIPVEYANRGPVAQLLLDEYEAALEA